LASSSRVALCTNPKFVQVFYHHYSMCHLPYSTIVLVLVSSDYLANDTCWSVELGRAFELHDEGTVRVIPVLVRTSRWQETPVARVQFVPRDGRAITCRERDSAWVTVAEEIALAIKHWRSDPSRKFIVSDPD
jgi:hypothetical protein